VVRLWLGQLYQELGRLRDAERVYRSHTYYGKGRLSTKPLSQRQLGKIYEQLEEYDRAMEAYEYFAHYWRDADPELQPMVEEARQAAIRLRGLRRE
jgi:tetratricopeptide (TPR) repeat protein